jgi:hypothetical protein
MDFGINTKKGVVLPLCELCASSEAGERKKSLSLAETAEHAEVKTYK